jgi:hypothetical protein
MTKTLRMPGFGSRPLAATTPSAVAGTAAAADASGAVASPTSRGRLGKGNFDPLFFLRGLDLAGTFSISPYGLA